MARVRLIHWNAAEARERAASIRSAGYEVDGDLPFPQELLRQLRANPPAAVVIDLTRLPGQGRDVGLALRHSKSTRYLPIVFVGGEPEKVERVRQQLPDAVFTTWNRIGGALKRAMAHPPENPVAPRSVLDGYSGTPLPKKLGIKPGSSVMLVEAPPDFRKTLGEIPEGAVVRDGSRGSCELLLWFVRSRDDLQRAVRQAAARDDFSALWILWPKKSSRLAGDLTQQAVRETGLAAGLVDYKICAVDATWSGLKFARRKSKGQGHGG